MVCTCVCALLSSINAAMFFAYFILFRLYYASKTHLDYVLNGIDVIVLGVVQVHFRDSGRDNTVAISKRVVVCNFIN